SLIAVPLLMSLDIPGVKMSGRVLGHTGGTIDKLESITGFKTEISIKQIEKIVGKSGAVIINQTANIAPADKKLYALRDVTGTVDSLPLIASSIMSKKIATGTDGIVLDVKVGDGAFMKSIDDARLLSHIMIDIGASLNIPVVVVLTSMEEPLGKEIGNINEVQEVVRMLQNKKSSANLLNISLTIVSQMAKM